MRAGPRLTPHTLNGSGVAVGRALVAGLENCQHSASRPAALYMRWLAHIVKH